MASVAFRFRFVLAVLAFGPTAVSAAPTASEDAAFLDATTWGVNASSFAELRTEGRERWLKAQLHPPTETRLPSAVKAALAPQVPLFDRVAAFTAQARAANALSDPDARKVAQDAYHDVLNVAAQEAAASAILRALYDPDQVRERLTWFWFNRFNIHQAKAHLQVMVGDYLDAAIRPHALGRFRDLLGATLRHPAMLHYLDNASNAVGHLNENYAREIMELHTLGVGSGYTQDDIVALARILTGIGVETNPEDPKVAPEHRADLVRAGLFTFNPNRHDYGDKVFLGHAIRGRGWAEVEEALDILARHPATARNVSRVLAEYYLGAPPPDVLAERLAVTFTRSDGDIAALLDALFHASDFAAAPTAFKDPMRYVLSALRLAYDTRIVLNTAPIQGWLNRLGEGLFRRTTPDGYPLAASAWNGPGQMTIRFEVARQIGSGPVGLFKPARPDAAEEPAFPILQNALYFSTLSGMLGEATRAGLARAVSPQDWNTLYLASPEFMR